MHEANPTRPGGGETGALAGARLVQVVLYVRDLAASRSFYERVLGLALVEGDPGSATYRTGQAQLRLRRAGDEMVTLDAADPSADLTFLVPHLDTVRDELAARGVTFTDTMRYVIGATTGFQDPDGHQISLYEPSAAAMTWPSGGKIHELLRAGGKDAAATGQGAPRPPAPQRRGWAAANSSTSSTSSPTRTRRSPSTTACSGFRTWSAAPAGAGPPSTRREW